MVPLNLPSQQGEGQTNTYYFQSLHLNLHPAVRAEVWRDGGRSPWYLSEGKALWASPMLGIQILAQPLCVCHPHLTPTL